MPFSGQSNQKRGPHGWKNVRKNQVISSFLCYHCLGPEADLVVEKVTEVKNPGLTVTNEDKSSLDSVKINHRKEGAGKEAFPNLCKKFQGWGYSSVGNHSLA